MSGQNEFTSNAYIIKDFIAKALSIKYYYVVSLIVCLAVAFLVNKVSPTVYEGSSIIGPMENNTSALLGSTDLFRGIGAYEQAKNLENDVSNAKSFTLVAMTLNKMNLEVGYYKKTTNILEQTYQIYPESPFTVSIDKSHNQPINIKFFIDIIDQNSFRLTSEEEDVALYNYLDNVVVKNLPLIKIDTICRFNETITAQYFKFVVSLNKERIPNAEDDASYYFMFYHLDQLSRQYFGSIEVSPLSLRSSLINVKFRRGNLDLTVDFLNKYLQTFLDDNLSKKNKISLNAINFIDGQISSISDSLNVSESQLKEYRSANQVMDLSYQGQKAFEQMTQIENERSTLQVQERYYKYVLDYLEKNKDVAGIAPPSAANVQDAIMTSLIMDLLALNSERSNIMSNNAEKNLFLGQIENKIRQQQQTIIENVKNNLNTLTITQNELDYRAQKLSREITKLPRTELNMVSMQRKFNLSDVIYTYLLQKRSEAAITMASNYPDYEILKPARKITASIISPKPMINWAVALFMALMLPTAFIILKNFFNEKIISVRDAENLIKKPVMAVIYNNNLKTQNVIADAPASHISESFRNLRSSLFLRFKKESNKVFMVTSSQPQDGKSFISYNLANSIASVGHKTILLDCDLRRPTLHTYFKSEFKKGITNYFADNTPIESIIYKSEFNNLSFIPAGPLLANASEFIEAGAVDELLRYCEDNYDFVIVDTSPTGLISDASQLMRYASLILLVCRNEKTRKDVFIDVLNQFRTNKIDNFDVVFNDKSISKSKYGHYSNYYPKS
jgi:capsular exopolysaccharide synthesis family protein